MDSDDDDIEEDFKFKYYNVQGVGEPIRMLFKYGKTFFVDNRIEFKNWDQLKNITPFGTLPMLSLRDGAVVTGPKAMGRYLAKQFNLVGDGKSEAMMIDATVDTIHEIRYKIAAHFGETDEKIRAAKLKIAEEAVPMYVRKLDEQVAENNGYFVGGKLSWAEFVFVGMLDFMNHMNDSDLIADAPNLQALKANFLKIPAIKEWVETRPITLF